MNICFYTSFEVSPTQGGTERITFTVAKNLIEKYGWKCYSIYFVKARTESVPELFEDTALINNPRNSYDKLLDILDKWKIDILINQGAFALSPIFSDVLKKIGAKYVFCHHFEPGWELTFLTFRGVIEDWQKNRSIKKLIKIGLFPWLKYRQRYTLPKDYASSYRLADRVVLLSKRFIPQFMKYGGIKDDSKFGVIHNSLSFEYFYDSDKLCNKDKVVLIVSRMEDTQKKISKALQIWNQIEKSNKFKDWKLILLGIGADLDSYKQYVRKHKLSQVSFRGLQAPEEYYRQASIFMMTSKSEGWGLTLTEAQQNGCIPIAFDTYASLHEIITDGYNGFIIPKDDNSSYIAHLEMLMNDSNLRNQMAVSAIKSSHRFEQKVIAEQWYNFLLDIYDSK